MRTWCLDKTNHNSIDPFALLIILMCYVTLIAYIQHIILNWLSHTFTWRTHVNGVIIRVPKSGSIWNPRGRFEYCLYVFFFVFKIRVLSVMRYNLKTWVVQNIAIRKFRIFGEEEVRDEKKLKEGRWVETYLRNMEGGWLRFIEGEGEKGEKKKSDYHQSVSMLEVGNTYHSINQIALFLQFHTFTNKYSLFADQVTQNTIPIWKRWKT